MQATDYTKIDFAKPIKSLSKELYAAQLNQLKNLRKEDFKTTAYRLLPMTWREFLAVAEGVN